ncbi:hypothetical protein [Paremcibacter congregatus]|uniref:hypothetical protein n=1 Tax=Paremcibacter congregatus TaxID=2043170 RepID=UPI003A8FA9AA
MTAAIKPDKTSATEKTNLLNLDDLLTEIAHNVTGNSIQLPAHFKFDWHGIHFAGQVLPSQNGQNSSLNLVANLGYIPFSAENKERRRTLITTFTPLFMKGEYSLSTSSQIQMILLTEFTGSVSARRLMEVITLTLLDLQEDLKDIHKSISA